MWIVWLPSALVMFSGLAGLWLLLVGLRGRWIKTDPHCRACDYNLTGLAGPRCPECGGEVEKVGITTRRRRRHWHYVYISILMMSLPLAVLLGMFTRYAGLIESSFDGYTWKPTTWVLSDTQSPDEELAMRAFYESKRRWADGDLSRAEIDRLAALAWERFCNDDEPLTFAKLSAADLIESFIERGAYTKKQVAEYFDKACRVEMTVSETADRSGTLRMGLNIAYLGKLSFGHLLSGARMIVADPDDMTPPAIPSAAQVWTHLSQDADSSLKKLEQPGGMYEHEFRQGDYWLWGFHLRRDIEWLTVPETQGPEYWRFYVDVFFLEENPHNQTLHTVHVLRRTFEFDTHVSDLPDTQRATTREQ